jgi:putative Mg2+ transporter-C (MgtC) family protein
MENVSYAAYFSFLVNVVLALVLGAIIGIERQWNQKVAGLKTNTLVCLGSSLFVSLSGLITGTTDHTRMAAQVISGIGFIGAGVMFKEGVNVKGLNTAATLWCAGAIGTLAGSGYHLEATTGTLLVVVTHLSFRPLAKFLTRINMVDVKDDEQYYTLHVVTSKNEMSAIKTILITELSQENMVVNALQTVKSDKKRELIAHIIAKSSLNVALERIINRVSQEEGIHQAYWRLERKDKDGGD